MERTYLAIDLKSFYASVECAARGLDPLRTNLVVADESRTDKTICLAVSPSLKARGIPGRPRLFEVIRQVAGINAQRRKRAPGGAFTGSSWDDAELETSPGLELAYITAMPRMSLYLECSARIYDIYLKYIAPEDIHVYSIDEVFIDATQYLKLYGLTAAELVRKLIGEVLEQTGVTATAGIAPNLYLCKVAMDIVAKHADADAHGVRIAELDEGSYREKLWSHRPLTDFWRVGPGYRRQLEAHGMFTMGDVARCSVHNEALLYRLFGVNAELLIDHAWGWEPCTIAEIKAYRPESSSLSSGQVLQEAGDFDRTRLIVREMADLLAFDLAEKGLVTDQLVLTVGYDRENLRDGAKGYKGAVTLDHYGRRIPRHAHGTRSLPRPTASPRQLAETAVALFDAIVDPALLTRRVNLVAGHVRPGETAGQGRQLDLFAGPEEGRAREEDLQQAVLELKKRYGKNAVVKGMNLKAGATAMERNRQIGGHKA